MPSRVEIKKSLSHAIIKSDETASQAKNGLPRFEETSLDKGIEPAMSLPILTKKTPIDPIKLGKNHIRQTLEARKPSNQLSSVGQSIVVSHQQSCLPSVNQNFTD